MKHTPGPWTAYELIIRSSDGCVIAESISVWKSSKANASLIASAPELLDVLKLITDDAENRGKNGGDANWAAIHLCRAIIAKAEGN
jgi:hypothetical protein